jgi:hypothetical protein
MALLIPYLPDPLGLPQINSCVNASDTSLTTPDASIGVGVVVDGSVGRRDALLGGQMRPDHPLLSEEFRA